MSFAMLDKGDYFVKIYRDDNPDATEIDAQFYSLSINTFTAVPEPSSLAILVGLSASVFLRRRKK